MISGFVIGIVIGFIVGLFVTYDMGWNAHVEFRRTADYAKADDAAQKEKKGLL